MSGSELAREGPVWGQRPMSQLDPLQMFGVSGRCDVQAAKAAYIKS